MTVGADERFVVISADCHAGGSMETYGRYLEDEYQDRFAEWRGAYRNPFRDLQSKGRERNWDSDQRIAELEKDGQVAEVIFPNTVPPFFPTGALVARPPTSEDLELRWAGLRAHNRWLADWCRDESYRRAGIAQVFLNDVGAAVEEAKWIAPERAQGRRPDPRRARRLRHRSAVLGDLRPALGRLRGARAGRELALRQRPSRLRRPRRHRRWCGPSRLPGWPTDRSGT